MSFAHEGPRNYARIVISPLVFPTRVLPVALPRQPGAVLCPPLPLTRLSWHVTIACVTPAQYVGRVVIPQSMQPLPSKVRGMVCRELIFRLHEVGAGKKIGKRKLKKEWAPFLTGIFLPTRPVSPNDAPVNPPPSVAK